MRWLMLILLGVVAATGACGDDTGNNEVGTGTLEVTTATSNPIAAEYNLIMDGASPRTVSANGTLSIPAVAEGTHLLQLAIPTGCVLDGENPRSVNVTANTVTPVAFTITCGTTG